MRIREEFFKDHFVENICNFGLQMSLSLISVFFQAPAALNLSRGTWLQEHAWRRCLLKKLCTGNEERGEVESETGEKGDKKGGKAGADKMG